MPLVPDKPRRKRTAGGGMGICPGAVETVCRAHPTRWRVIRRRVVTYLPSLRGITS